MSINIIKKPFVCIALVMVLLLGMTITVSAANKFVRLPNNTILEGELKFYNFHGETLTPVKLSIDGENNLSIDFIGYKDEKISVKGAGWYEPFERYYSSWINDEWVGNDEYDVSMQFEKLSETEYKVYTFYWSALSGDVHLEGTVKVVPDEIGTQSLSTMFSGNTSSKWKEYDVALSGRIKGDFKEGVNELTADQIKEQTISAVLYNTLTDEIVTRNVNSITGVKVTVNSGKITNVEIDGKAKTPEGRADVYNAKIDL